MLQISENIHDSSGFYGVHGTDRLLKCDVLF